MPYVASPTDPTQPEGPDIAGYAADELRALKAYIQTLVLGAAGFKVPVRQTVLAASCAAAAAAPFATPTPNFIQAGAGLTIDFKATGLPPAVLAFANGFDGNGNVDYVTQLSADIANIHGTLAANAHNYLYVDRATATTVTGGSTVKTPQEGYTYDRGQAAMLHFNGAAGATTFLDDFGNTWQANGSPKLQINQFKFGSAGLGGSGGTNALASTDGIKSAEVGRFATGDGWTLRGWVYVTALPGVGVYNNISCDLNAALAAAGFGFRLGIYNSGGNSRFNIYLSGDNVGWTLINNQLSTTNLAINTWYYVEFTYDWKADVYRLYVNGTQEYNSAASIGRVALPGSQPGILLGGGSGMTGITGYLDDWEFLPYCDHPNGTAYVAPLAESSFTAKAPDFFNISDMKMYQMTAASSAAGSNPTMTQVNRLYWGEAATSGVAVTAVYPYALRGKFCSGLRTWPGSSTTQQVQHNLGSKYASTKAAAVMRRTFNGWTPGARAKPIVSWYQVLASTETVFTGGWEPCVVNHRIYGTIITGLYGLVVHNGNGINWSAVPTSDADLMVEAERTWGIGV